MVYKYKNVKVKKEIIEYMIWRNEVKVDLIASFPIEDSKDLENYKKYYQNYEDFIRILESNWVWEYEDIVKEIFIQINNRKHFYCSSQYQDLIYPIIKIILKYFDRNGMWFLDNFLIQNYSNNFESISWYGWIESLTYKIEILLSKYAQTDSQIELFIDSVLLRKWGSINKHDNKRYIWNMNQDVLNRVIKILINKIIIINQIRESY